MREHSRLQWRCRRGTRELDLLLQAYLEQRYPSDSARRRRAFERLLECQDSELQAWLTGALEPPDREIRHVVETIRHSHPTAT